MTPIEAFLLGITVTASITAAVFFLKFWRSTRDWFFFAFAAFFLIEGADRIALLFFHEPNEASPWIYIVRLIALLVLLTAIVRKNYGHQ
jgi:uncharacterized membrane protein HdeD (DUF308 family)